MSRPKSRIALVTGVSRKSGIGAAVASQLARDGLDVFISYYRPFDLESKLGGDPHDPENLLKDLQSLGVRAAGLEIDLADAGSPGFLFDKVEAALGPVSILVNNAAYSMRDGIENLDADMLDRHYAVNIRAMALLCAEFVRRYKIHFSSMNSGRIINLSSGQALAAMPGELAYVITKGAVEAFTLSLSAEVASLGITVNAIDPGITDTGWIPPELMAKWTEESPYKRVGRPLDAARLIRFLASEEAGWITGQVIHSRGGM